MLARLAQLASVEAKDAVLDIGCATGYSTAVLAHLARAVTAVEAEPELAAAARETLQALGLDNAAVVDGDHARGAPNAGPFDVILLNGSVPEVPESLLAQLKDGGRLVAVVATGPQGRPRQGKAYSFRQSGWRGERLATFRRQRQAIARLQLFSCLHVLAVPRPVAALLL